MSTSQDTLPTSTFIAVFSALRPIIQEAVLDIRTGIAPNLIAGGDAVDVTRSLETYIEIPQEWPGKQEMWSIALKLLQGMHQTVEDIVLFIKRSYSAALQQDLSGAREREKIADWLERISYSISSSVYDVKSNQKKAGKKPNNEDGNLEAD